MFGHIIIELDSDRPRDEQIAEASHTDYKNLNIEEDIEIDKVKSRICADDSWKFRFELSSTRFSSFQIKYQQYIEPYITKKIAEIQYYLNYATQDIRTYNKVPGLQSEDKSIKEIAGHLLSAAKLTQEIIEWLDSQKNSE